MSNVATRLRRTPREELLWLHLQNWGFPGAGLWCHLGGSGVQAQAQSTSAYKQEIEDTSQQGRTPCKGPGQATPQAPGLDSGSLMPFTCCLVLLGYARICSLTHMHMPAHLYTLPCGHAYGTYIHGCIFTSTMGTCVCISICPHVPHMCTLCMVHSCVCPHVSIPVHMHSCLHTYLQTDACQVAHISHIKCT